MPDTEHACGCSEEYGPCTGHSTVLTVRQGAAVRTAHELSLTFIDDCVGLVTLTPDESAEYRRLAELLEDNRSPLTGVAWLPDTTDDYEALQDLVDDVEGRLPADVRVDWEDGYTITRITGGPLLDED